MMVIGNTRCRKCQKRGMIVGRGKKCWCERCLVVWDLSDSTQKLVKMKASTALTQQRLYEQGLSTYYMDVWPVLCQKYHKYPR